MNILKKIPLLLVLCLALFASSSLVANATDYCNSSVNNSSKSDDKKVVVYNGNSLRGACHIQRLHMANPGANSWYVDGVKKSQFSFAFDRTGMASVAAIVIRDSTAQPSYAGRYVSEAYVATLNQDVRVVWENYQGLKSVYTMFPTKSYGSKGPIMLPTSITPIDELQLESKDLESQ
ncbi:hypothetical protein [Lysinibacillus sp. 3P01SB]|uniref:hypothetical protein n=1 Tax=Lysinibacillus sp. 3P01SB TaxID=3132284 RepID=UPI0039A478FC